MARQTGPVCRMCRREGVKLFLKGMKCVTPKCPVEKRNQPPGQHGAGGRRSRRVSDYGLRLREKQRAKRIAGLMERQFTNVFARAARMPGMTGGNLLQILARRLDAVAHRLGFASSRAAARQLILHGHVQVNGRKVTIPSYLAEVGDEVALRDRTRANVHVVQAQEDAKKRGWPSWVAYHPETWTGKILAFPSKDEAGYPVQEQLIVELYSK